MGFLDFLTPKKPVHLLKWPLPEELLSVPLLDSEKTVGLLKKQKAVFASGGEFRDSIYAKTYGENVYSYFIVRVDLKTEKETLFADPYMIQEEDRLGFELSSSFSMSGDLEKMCYAKAFDRVLTEWRFKYGVLRAGVFDIDGLGSFLELALPQTKLATAREAQEKIAYALVGKLGFKKEEIIPLDVITLQLMSLQPPPQAPRQPNVAMPDVKFELGQSAGDSTQNEGNKSEGKKLF